MASLYLLWNHSKLVKEESIIYSNLSEQAII